LAELLNKLQDQVTNGLFSYSVAVVDNDHDQSAKKVVESFNQQSSLSVKYYTEPEQNIALARNKAVETAKGNFIAFIDDDEFPVKEWLLNLYKTCIQFNADGVLGPVKPNFESEPPKWIIEGKLHERASFKTGTRITNSRDARTGNVLLSRRIFRDGVGPFDRKFGRTGGEDTDFFKRMMAKGYIFTWCDEAYVYEVVPPHRLKRVYFIKRALLRGQVESRHVPFTSRSTFKSIMAVVLYTSVLPFLFLTKHYLFMKCLIKDCDHIGKLLGLCGLNIIKERAT